MFTKLSKIIIPAATICGITITMIKTHAILMSLLNGLVCFILTFLLFAILEFTFGIILSKQFSKDKNLLKPKYVKFYNDLAEFAITWLNLRIHVKGLEKLDKDKIYVFYSNHQGFTDILIYNKILKDWPHSSLFKKELMQNPFIGGIAKGLGGISINRDNDKEAVRSILASIKVVNGGRSFMVYPEGHRSRTGEIKDFHSGSFKIALKTKADICFLMVDGAYTNLTYVPLIPTKINVEIVGTMKNEEFINMTSIDLATMAHDKISESLIESRK